MPVSTGVSETANANRSKRCKHCEESGHRVDSGNLFWRIQLDQDLLDTIVAIYPEWFKDYNVARVPGMADGGNLPNNADGPGRSSQPSHSLALPTAQPDAQQQPPAAAQPAPLKVMDKNKESLKVKLMLRRPINQLVAQGIMPPLKTSPAFHEQRQKLERAKMGDLLKAKIQQRPDRQELVRQHILEDNCWVILSIEEPPHSLPFQSNKPGTADMSHIDPSLAERQRMLKKARLVDALNDQLSHRPGPLELIKKNILHTDEPIERAVKEGVIPFKATCEGQLTKPQHPDHYVTYDDDSQSSEGAGSPLQGGPIPSLPSPHADAIETAASNAGIVTVAVAMPTSVVVTTQPFQPRTTMTFADLCNSVARSISPPTQPATLAPAPSPMSLGSTTSSLSPLSSISVASPTGPPTPSPTVTITPRPLPSPVPHRDAPGKDKNRKKSKSKNQPKTRTIKFHEYKGPPNAHKATPLSASSVETSYEILLHQQQLFLQWQLEWQHKYPQIILPAGQKPLSIGTSDGAAVSFVQATSPAAQHAMSVAAPAPSPGGVATSPAMMAPLTPQQVTVMAPTEQQAPGRTLSKLEDMKVSDLKAELKRRNLPVSGSKPQLIERLKPFTEPSVEQTSIPVSHMGHIIMDIPGSVMSEESLSGMSSMENPGSPGSQQVNHAVEGSIHDDNESVANLSPASQQQLSPASQSMSPEGVDLDMDTSESSMMACGSSPLGSPPPASPVVGEDIIREQQRRIKELQRELHRSQLQLQQIRHNKDGNGTQPRLKQAATISTLPNGIVIDTKQHQKLMLQQHLQNKIQQQQLQMQLQQLQQLQTLQQQQQAQQQQRQQQHVAFQQQQKQIQQGLNAKASLAAFLQSQSQQQQLTSLIQQQAAAAANNKNNNNATVNNKKNGVVKNIVLGQQQAALVLNQLNSQQKATLLNGVTAGHQRTASLPNFFGSFVPQSSPAAAPQPSPPEDTKPVLTRINTEPQFLAKPPPPQYEEATKQLKVKLEVPSPAEPKPKQKNVKSQIVDDVLEILIKNGELPASAAQDPATPTTPGRSLPQSLVFARTETASPPAPPPPPPPPLPHTTFAVTLPTAIALTTHAETPFQLQFTGADSLDFILGGRVGNDGPAMLGDMQATPGMDLKELGLDLETLDTMDFGQLDCGDLAGVSVKMETASEMEAEPRGGEKHEESLHDQLINQQPCELMDIEMPMDMDDSDWLESLMPSDGPGTGPLLSAMTPPHQVSYLPAMSGSGGFHFSNGGDIDTYDPLLSNSQDPFDLFNIEDSEFKMAGDLNSALGWDKVDFAT